MSETSTVSLEARSPYELRVHLGDGLPEQSVREALATGDMGFLHSYTTGSTVDGPGVRVVAWTTGCTWRCQYCHNPDTWTMSNGIPVSVTKAAEQLGKYRHGLKLMSGGFTLSGGDPLMQHRFSATLTAMASEICRMSRSGGYSDPRWRSVFATSAASVRAAARKNSSGMTRASQTTAPRPMMSMDFLDGMAARRRGVRPGAGRPGPVR